MTMWNDYEKIARRLDRIAKAFERIANALETANIIEADRKTEPSGYKMKPIEQTEPQYDIDKGTIKCDNCSENGSYKCSKCDGEIYFKRLEVDDEPQIDGAIDEARFKAHCMNCQRDVADIKCLDCDGDKYFIADEPQTDCSWK